MRDDARERDGRLFAVPLAPRSGAPGTSGAAAPRPLFQTSIGPNPYVEQYAVDATGSRFLLLAPDPLAPRPFIVVVINWPAFGQASVAP